MLDVAGHELTVRQLRQAEGQIPLVAGQLTGGFKNSAAELDAVFVSLERGRRIVLIGLPGVDAQFP
ncbi:MAG TPA: hypothetical protein VFW44_07135, partial [Bryobacteraceae bacterium]|nr:hypothetical protein [Bryobacteraceae bacterium]